MTLPRASEFPLQSSHATDYIEEMVIRIINTFRDRKLLGQRAFSNPARLRAASLERFINNDTVWIKPLHRLHNDDDPDLSWNAWHVRYPYEAAQRIDNTYIPSDTMAFWCCALSHEQLAHVTHLNMPVQIRVLNGHPNWQHVTDDAIRFRAESQEYFRLFYDRFNFVQLATAALNGDGHYFCQAASYLSLIEEYLFGDRQMAIDQYRITYNEARRGYESQNAMYSEYPNAWRMTRRSDGDDDEVTHARRHWAHDPHQLQLWNLDDVPRWNRQDEDCWMCWVWPVCCHQSWPHNVASAAANRL